MFKPKTFPEVSRQGYFLQVDASLNSESTSATE